MKKHVEFHPAMPQELQRLIRNAENAVLELQQYIEEENHQNVEHINPELYCAMSCAFMYQAVSDNGSIVSRVRQIRAMNKHDYRLILHRGFKELIDLI